MSTGNPSYNPNLTCKDNPNWFKSFIQLQDEVPSELIKKKEDSVFLKHRIIQIKVDRPKSFNKSLFTAHQLKPSGAEPSAREISNHGWIAGIIAICFIFYSISHYGYFRRVQQIVKAFFASGLFSQLAREGGVFSERVSLFLFSSYLMALSLFFYKILEFYYSVPPGFLLSFLLYLEILAGIIIFYLLKLGLLRLLGFIFKADREVADYILNVYILGQMAGVALLPVIVLMAYMQSEFVIYAGSAALLLLYLYSMFRGLIMVASKVKVPLFYLFLYLCTLEILPLFLIAKVLSKIFI
jgi:hypothetical protein